LVSGIACPCADGLYRYSVTGAAESFQAMDGDSNKMFARCDTCTDADTTDEGSAKR
jgi:hypothetical protein